MLITLQVTNSINNKHTDVFKCALFFIVCLAFSDAFSNPMCQ